MELALPTLSAKLSASVKYIGRERTPVLVIDNCLADPQLLVEFASQTQRAQASGELPVDRVFESDSAGFYPGLRCALPAHMGQHFLQQLTPLLNDCFGSPQANLVFEHGVSSLSLAGVKKESLRPIQSLPHFDDTRDDQFAVVLYLFDGDLGGTGFYRHISTGYERIGRERLHHYAPRLKAEAMAHKEILFRYMGRENALFENTEYVAPAFNRAVIYPSNCLHSGVLNNELDYSLCASKGRLTANMLFIRNEVYL